MGLLADLQSHLQTNSIVDGVTGWSLFLSYLPPDPAKVVVITETGGLDPDLTDGTKYDMPTFQILCRGEKHGYEAMRTQFTSIFNTLHAATIAGYVYVYAKSSGPIFLGYDANERPEATMNFECMKAR